MRCQAASLQGLAFLIAASMADPSSADETALRYDWSGAYIGANLGGALTLTDIDDPFGASIYGDTVRSPGPLAGGQIGYNWQVGRALLGLEADASWADLFGTETCFAYSGYYISANCRTIIDALGTVSARAGWTVGDGATLLYGKAGAAWMHSDVDATTNNNAGFPSSASDHMHWGWMLGAGIERAIGGRWSMKAEYDYLSFAGSGFATPVGSLQPTPNPTPANLIAVPSTATDASAQMHLFKVGLNYHLYEPHTATPADGWLPVRAPQPVTNTALEVGARYVYGWGRFQKDLGIQGEGISSLASRLTYSDMNTNGAELFARLDLPSGLMVKGFVGKGNGNGGHLNDEDWGLPFDDFVPYSNTLSTVDDRIRYGVIDVGYDIWRTEQFRFAPFVGYSIFHQYMLGRGCDQIANPHSDCPMPIPVSTDVISEDDTWRALRLGISADIEIIPGITLSADAAYLGYVHFSGVDDHILRSLVSPESANGNGAQLELMLKYALTEQLSVGVGGRYWTMWTRDGTVNFGGEAIVPMRYSVEQAALLVQGAYTFSVSTD